MCHPGWILLLDRFTLSRSSLLPLWLHILLDNLDRRIVLRTLGLKEFLLAHHNPSHHVLGWLHSFESHVCLDLGAGFPLYIACLREVLFAVLMPLWCVWRLRYTRQSLGCPGAEVDAYAPIAPRFMPALVNIRVLS